MRKIKINLIVLVLLIACSNQVYRTLALKCYSCTSADTKCIDDVNATTPTADCTEKVCYTEIDESGVVTRGCKPKAECIAQNCTTCETDNCNDNVICKSCDSTSDLECVQINSSKQSYNSICAAGYHKCITQINTNDGRTTRSCANNIEANACEAKQDTCQVCDKGNCNVNIFPAERRMCYQCSNNSSCNDVSSNSIANLTCSVYKADDVCYIYATSATNMVRGCYSDKDAKCTKDSTDELCFNCASNNCNNLQFKRKQMIQCLQCDSKSSNDCLKEQDIKNAKACQEIQYNQPDLCYTQISNNIAYRGCYNERSADLGDCNTTNNCNRCSEEGCNRQVLNITFTCIRCRSDEQPDCIKKPEALIGECRNSQGSTNSGCFSGVWNNIVIRGCMVDADERMQFVCNDKNNKKCETCTDPNCNNKPRSGAAALTIAGTNLLGIVIVALRQHF